MFGTGIVIILFELTISRICDKQIRDSVRTNCTKRDMNILTLAGNISLHSVIEKIIPSEPQQNWSKILFFCITFAGFIIISLYKAMLSATISISINKAPSVSSFEDILNLKYHIALSANTQLEKLFTDANVGAV